MLLAAAISFGLVLLAFGLACYRIGRRDGYMAAVDDMYQNR